MEPAAQGRGVAEYTVGDYEPRGLSYKFFFSYPSESVVEHWVAESPATGGGEPSLGVGEGVSFNEDQCFNVRP